MAGAQDGMCLESRYAFFSNSFLLYVGYIICITTIS